MAQSTVTTSADSAQPRLQPALADCCECVHVRRHLPGDQITAVAITYQIRQNCSISGRNNVDMAISVRRDEVHTFSHRY